VKIVFTKTMNRHLAAFSIPMTCVVVFCLLLLITGKATPFISGFAIDKNDWIYVGEETEICVYENDVLIRTINPQTSRAYAFTIADDQILLSTASIFYIMDLDGNIWMRKMTQAHICSISSSIASENLFPIAVIYTS